jgi:hypothetical protein
LGLEATFNKKRDCFSVLAFFVDTPSVRTHKMRPYNALFLDGIEPSDSIQSIEKKMRGEAVVSRFPQESTLRYSLQGRELTFFFDETGARMRLAMIKLI